MAIAPAATHACTKPEEPLPSAASRTALQPYSRPSPPLAVRGFPSSVLPRAAAGAASRSGRPFRHSRSVSCSARPSFPSTPGMTCLMHTQERRCIGSALAVHRAPLPTANPSLQGGREGRNVLTPTPGRQHRRFLCCQAQQEDSFFGLRRRADSIRRPARSALSQHELYAGRAPGAGG